MQRGLGMTWHLCARRKRSFLSTFRPERHLVGRRRNRTRVEEKQWDPGRFDSLPGKERDRTEGVGKLSRPCTLLGANLDILIMKIHFRSQIFTAFLLVSCLRFFNSSSLKFQSRNSTWGIGAYQFFFKYWTVKIIKRLQYKYANYTMQIRFSFAILCSSWSNNGHNGGIA